VYELDIAALNVSNAQEWPDEFTVGDLQNFALYYNSTKLRHARWPKARQNLTAQYPSVAADKRFLMSRSGGVPMRAALAGTSKAWTKGDHKTPGVFAVYEQTVPDLRRFASAVKHGLWLEGNWRVDFVETGVRVAGLSLNDPANATVRLASVPPGGLGWKYDKRSTGCGCEPFHVINALESITEEGEFALDFLDRKVYAYLPSRAGAAGAGESVAQNSLLTLADNGSPVLRLQGAHDVTIKGLRVGYSLGDAIEISAPTGRVEVVGSVLHNIDGNGVTVHANANSSSPSSPRVQLVTIRSNDIRSTGDGGVYINGGGDVRTLTPGNVTVTNNHLHDIGLNGFSKGYGVTITGGAVGVVVSHNLIHHVSGKAIHGGHRTSTEGNEGDPSKGGQGQFGTLIEYNELFQIGLNASGIAAIYMCCGPVDAAGGVVRYNFVHSSPNVNSIGWDNQLSGQIGYGNVFYYTQNGYGLNHGSFNSMTNNLIIRNSPKPGATSFQANAGISIACRGFSDVYNCSLKAFAPWLEELQYVDINGTSSAWHQRFGWYLGGICGAIASTDGKNQRITGNYADSNAMIYIENAFSNSGCVSTDSKHTPINNNTFSNTYQLPVNSTVDAGFVDYAHLNFTLRPDSPIYRALPDFKPIPFNEIGLHTDDHRRSLPTDAETGRLALAPAAAGA
jgi:hypothetical protein